MQWLSHVSTWPVLFKERDLSKSDRVCGSESCHEQRRLLSPSVQRCFQSVQWLSQSLIVFVEVNHVMNKGDYWVRLCRGVFSQCNDYHKVWSCLWKWIMSRTKHVMYFNIEFWVFRCTFHRSSRRYETLLCCPALHAWKYARRTSQGLSS